MLKASLLNQSPQLTSAEYEYGNGMFILKPIGRVLAMKITFIGVPSITPQIEGYTFKFTEKNVLTITINSYNNLEGEIFYYEGYLKIKKVEGCGIDRKRIKFGGQNRYIATFKELESEFYFLTTTFSQLNTAYTINKTQAIKSIKEVKLKTVSNLAKTPKKSSYAYSSAFEGGGSGGGGL